MVVSPTTRHLRGLMLRRGARRICKSGAAHRGAQRVADVLPEQRHGIRCHAALKYGKPSQMVVSPTTRHLRGLMLRRGARRICKALLSLLLPVLAHAEQLPIRIYRTADGLARDDVQSVVADKAGYLWFGTVEGLSRFDGYEFTNYGLNEGLPHASANALLLTRDGGLWIGTSRGLCRFNPESRLPSGHQFTVYQPSAVRGTQFIIALAEDRDGSIWCGTGAGLFRLRRPSPSRAQ